MNNRPIIFGEVLFDTFEDGSSVLGGAPFNVASHLTAFGHNPLLISRIGNDINGNALIEKMKSYNMDISGIQYDDIHPTGAVSVVLDKGQPTFTIHPNQAYDYIEKTEGLPHCSILYHGSLTSRNVSKNALKDIINEMKPPVFVDINLRDPWWNIDTIEEMLYVARWAKMNVDELFKISGSSNDPLCQAQKIHSKYNLELVIVTMGGDGSLYVSDDSAEIIEPVPVNKIVDTVGAGDAFSAVTIKGLIEKKPYKTILQEASLFASKICQQRGGTN